jgi:hypothetical protein
MPTFRHGKNTTVNFSSYDLSTYLTSQSNSNAVETVETTTFGSANKTYKLGLQEGTVSFEGLWAGDTSGIDEVFAAALGGATPKVITVGIEGSAIGRRAILAYTNQTSYEIKGAIADLVTISAQAQVTGSVDGLDRGVLLASSQVISATVANSSVDNTASSANGGVAHLHVPVNSRNGAVTVKVQHSANNSTWVDLVTFTPTTNGAITSERIEVAAGTTVNRYIRANVSGFAGTTGSATITVGFARR